MAWIIQSACDGPILINDLGLTLHKGQMKDLDLLGRENAERSNDVKVLLNMNPPRIRTVKKDPYTPPGQVDPQVLKDLTETASKARETVEAQAAIIKDLRDDVSAAKENAADLRAQNQAIILKMEAVLSAVSKFAEEHPREIRTIKEAIENIKVERSQIAEKKAEIQASTDMTDAEIKMQDKLLTIRDKKLEKNYKDLGKTITKGEDASVDEALDAMDELGI